MEIRYSNKEMLEIAKGYFENLDADDIEIVNIKSKLIDGKRTVSFTVSGKAADDKEDIDLSTGDVLKVTL